MLLNLAADVALPACCCKGSTVKNVTHISKKRNSMCFCLLRFLLMCVTLLPQDPLLLIATSTAWRHQGIQDNQEGNLQALQLD